MPIEKESTPNFFEFLSKLTNFWLKELENPDPQKYNADLFLSLTKVIDGLTNIDPPDELHKKIYTKTLAIIQWIARDLKNIRILKGLSKKIFLGKIPEALSQDEKKLIENLVALLYQLSEEQKASERFSLETKKINIITTKEKTRTLILLKTTLPDIIGDDLLRYRGLDKNTIINIPKRNAQILKDRLRNLVEILKNQEK